MIRVETLPLILGIIVGLVGLAILADAWLPEEMPFRTERRRRERTERSLGGEAAIGLGVMCLAAAIIGRDTWAYSIVAVIAGAVLFLLGVLLNWNYLRERISHRGALRRGGASHAHREKGGKDKIR